MNLFCCVKDFIGGIFRHKAAFTLAVICLAAGAAVGAVWPPATDLKSYFTGAAERYFYFVFYEENGILYIFLYRLFTCLSFSLLCVAVFASPFLLIINCFCIFVYGYIFSLNAGVLCGYSVVGVLIFISAFLPERLVFSFVLCAQTAVLFRPISSRVEEGCRALAYFIIIALAALILALAESLTALILFRPFALAV